MDFDPLEISWKECLKIVLESLGFELVLHKLKPFTSHGKYVWWDARALSPCGAEVTVVLRNSALPFKEYPDGSKIWYPISNAYGSSEEEACKHYVECFLLDRALDPVWLNSRGKWNELEGFPRSSLEELALFLDLNA